MPRGGKRPGQRGRPERPPEEHHQRRLFTLPPDVVVGLALVPRGEQSQLVARLLRAHFEAQTDGAGINASAVA